MSRRSLVVMLVLPSILVGMLAAPATAREVGVDRAPLEREFTVDGTAAPEPHDRHGTSLLVRHPDRLWAAVHARGLEPGGVYTFWWVAVQGEGAFPDDVFVAHGAGVVANRAGRATAVMRAELGQPGITGFSPAPGVDVGFDELRDPMGALVRVEVAYHGQVEDAGKDRATWLRDFRSGAACPPATPNPNPAQPHSPVWFPATHRA